MKIIFTICSLTLLHIYIFGQQNTMLMHSYYKDRLFDPSRAKTYTGGSFLPLIESEYNLNAIIRDSSKQYYEIAEYLFKKHLIEFKDSNYFITISPILDVQLGQDLKDSNTRKLFQNTRGFFIEGDILKNVSFSSAFFENQARFSNYETNYYNSIGELYPNKSGGYITQNAVIPSFARTKPFKVDGFDYAMAVGNIQYKPNKSVVISAGNSAHFIGDGYRSLLLSDNTTPAPFVRGIFYISKKVQFHYMRMRLINPIRKPVSSSAEAYFESKGFSINYLTYTPSKKLSLSFFEGIIWAKDNATSSNRVNPLFYCPLPFYAESVTTEKERNAILGLNISWVPSTSHRFYGQFVTGNIRVEQTAFQLGYRGYKYFGLDMFMLQIEYNNVSKNMYQSPNSRLNYSGYNLPLAHIKGAGFQEFIVRSNYEWKKLYIDFKGIVYLLNDYNPLALLPIDKVNPHQTGGVTQCQIELGFRINRKMNLNLFGTYQVRNELLTVNNMTNLVFVGLRTGIINRYTDF